MRKIGSRRPRFGPRPTPIGVDFSTLRDSS
jgi:hypothetical protein